MRTPIELAESHGELDITYLEAALGRAGLPAAIRAFEAFGLPESWSGTKVTRVWVHLEPAGTAPELALLHKTIPWDHPLLWATSPDAAARNDPRGLAATSAEVACAIGARSDIFPKPLRSVYLDVSQQTEQRAFWLLMRDVGPGIPAASAYGSPHVERMLRSIAPLHARFLEGPAGRGPRDAPEYLAAALSSLETATDLFVAPVRAAALGDVPSDGWIRRMVERFDLRSAVPRFLEALTPREADDYLHLLSTRHAWLTALARHPHTIVHGDLRRSNIAWLDGAAYLFDWELASWAPPTVDIAWHWFWQSWAFPPRGTAAPSSWADGAPLREAYEDALARALYPYGRRAPIAWESAWALSFVRVVAQAGFRLIDPARATAASPETIARAERTARRAVDVARKLHDRYVR